MKRKACSFKKLYNSDGIVCIISYFRDYAIFAVYSLLEEIPDSNMMNNVSRQSEHLRTS